MISNSMITQFKEILEKLDISDIEFDIEDENTELVNKIKQELSIITYKRKNNPKPIRIKKIGGYFDKKDFKDINLIYRTYITIDLSNGDKIYAKLSVYKNENNINIKINDKIVYDIDNKKFNNEYLIDKLVEKYKEYLLKNYKIRD
ncbi:hypothetical protein M0Q97_12215 [Candidatus Dojkabacteria bacterium]|nr:hypothetical protein [Candidatus Dojkabacteria bacterium]